MEYIIGCPTNKENCQHFIIHAKRPTDPSIKEVLPCHCPNLKYIPKRVCQHFGSVLDDRCVIFENWMEALLMLNVCCRLRRERERENICFQLNYYA